MSTSVTAELSARLRQNRENSEKLRDTSLELLIKLADEAWQRYPGDSQRRLRREHVRAALVDDLTWIVVERVQPQALSAAVQWLLHQATLRRTRAADAERRRLLGLPPESAEPSTLADPSPGVNSSTEEADSERDVGAALFAAPTSRTAERLAARVRVETRLCRLDTVMVDGRPIGDCTVAEVKAWATRRHLEMREAGRDARFALALVSNLGSGEVIRNHWRDPNAVDALYDRAEAEYGTL